MSVVSGRSAPASPTAPREGPGARALDLVVDGALAVGRPVLRAALDAWLQLAVVGADAVPVSGGVLLAATHSSHADSLAIGAAVRRPVRLLGSRELASTRVLGPLLPRLGMVPVDRGAADAAALEQLAAVLTAGDALVVYPEGSRSRDGSVHRPRSGVARLATLAGVPVVPVGVTGTAAVWPVDARPRLRHGAAVRVTFGAPLPPPGPGPRDRRAWNDTLHDALVELSGRPRTDALAPVGGVA